jgi:hypothetical protein
MHHSALVCKCILLHVQHDACGMISTRGEHKHPPHPPFSRPSPISRMSQIPPRSPLPTHTSPSRYVSPASSDSLASGHLCTQTPASSTSGLWAPAPASSDSLASGHLLMHHILESANEFGCTCCMISCCTVVKVPRCGVALVKHKHPPHPRQRQRQRDAEQPRSLAEAGNYQPRGFC